MYTQILYMYMFYGLTTSRKKRFVLLGQDENIYTPTLIFYWTLKIRIHWWAVKKVALSSTVYRDRKWTMSLPSLGFKIEAMQQNRSFFQHSTWELRHFSHYNDSCCYFGAHWAYYWCVGQKGWGALFISRSIKRIRDVKILYYKQVAWTRIILRPHQKSRNIDCRLGPI